MQTSKPHHKASLPKGWERRKLGEVCTITTGHKDVNQGNDKGKFPFFTCSKDISYSDVYSFDSEAILIAGNGDVGNIHYFSGKFEAYQRTYVLQFFQIKTMFLWYHLEFSLKKQLGIGIIGSSIPYIKKQNLMNFTFLVCKPKEQTAITQVLSDTDALIQAIQQLIDKKKALKTATMQQLLTGKTRLPGFSGKWERKKLGEMAKVSKGETISKEDTQEGSIPVVAGGLQPSFFTNKQNRPGATITISASGANAGHIAFYTSPIFASDCSTIGESDHYNIQFLYFFLKGNQRKITYLQVGGAQPHVYPKQIKSIYISIPPSLTEQAAIAQVLSDMDEEIQALYKQKEKYQRLKKGIMQQLLTGKIRLV